MDNFKLILKIALKSGLVVLCVIGLIKFVMM